jgi:peptidyl-dipeptidase Dcp
VIYKSLTAGTLAAALSMVLGTAAASDSGGQSNKSAASPQLTAADMSANRAANPFFAPSRLPLQTPDFRTIRDEHVEPAFIEGMSQHLAEIEAIANNPEPPTIKNTLEAMERSGEVLGRVGAVFFNLTGTDSTDGLRAIQSRMAPKLAAHEDAILLNGPLFKRVKALYDGRESLKADAEDLRLIDQTYKRFVRAGAMLDESAKTRVRALNEEEASLTTAFQQALLKQSEASAVIVDSEAELDGLSADAKAAAAKAAADAGHSGKWLLRITNTTRQPVLITLKNRALRQRVWEASTSRGLKPGAGDTRAAVLRLTALRAERAKLLGYANHAAYQLESQMAGTPKAVLDMVTELVPTVMANARSEAADIQALIREQGGDFELQPWDWEFYAEQVRAARYALDADEVKNYFELDRVLKDGVFYALNRLYGVRFVERKDLPVYHPDVRVFDVFESDGSQIGLFYADYFARTGKRGGAWMSSFVGQSTLLDQKPVVINVMNIPKPVGDAPALMSVDEVITMFHEIGHGVHGLFSKVRYPSLAGTSVPRDYVEFPSQFDEDWYKHPEVIANYAKHYKTGKPIPPALLQKVIDASGFNEGFDTLEYLSATLLDMEWHTIAANADVKDVEAFEKAALAKYGVDFAPVPPRYRSAYFAHVFPGGYSSGYYAYLWSEVLAADAFAHVAAQGGLKRDIGDRYRQQILSRGNSEDPMQMYIQWRGQKPDVEYLLRRRGLSKSDKSN